MEVLYYGLRALIGWGATFSFIPVVAVTAVGMLFNALRQTRLPRFANVALTLAGLAVATYGVQPFLRSWYKHQSDRDDLELSYQKLCLNRTGCREGTSGRCTQMALDLEQWPITLAFTECMGKLFAAAQTIQGIASLSMALLFLLGLCVVLVAGGMLHRRTLQYYHVKRDARLRELATGVKPPQSLQ